MKGRLGLIRSHKEPRPSGKLHGHGSLTRPDGVVKLPVECVGFDLGIDHHHLGIADFYLGRIAVGVGVGMHGEAGSFVCCTGQLDRQFVARQRSSLSLHRYVS